MCTPPPAILPSGPMLFPCEPLVHRIGLRDLTELILGILLPLLFRRLGPRARPHARFVLGNVVLPCGGRRLLLRLLLRLLSRVQRVRTTPCEDLGRLWRVHRINLLRTVPHGD